MHDWLAVCRPRRNARPPRHRRRQEYQEYYGSASEYQKGQHKNVEGKKILLPIKGKIADTLNEMHEDLQSAVSYAGGRDLAALTKVDYVIVKNSIFNGDQY